MLDKFGLEMSNKVLKDLSILPEKNYMLVINFWEDLKERTNQISVNFMVLYTLSLMSKK